MQYKELLKQRYATKAFDGRKIPQEQIEELLEIIRLSPTSFNLQPWKLKIVEDLGLKEKIQAAAWNQPQVTSCSHLFVFCACTDFDSRIDHLKSKLLSTGMPSEAVEGYISMMSGFIAKLDEAARLAWAQRQVYIALSNGLNGAKALGFDSCPMEGFEQETVQDILSLPADHVVTVLMPVGYASDEARPKLRFDKADMVLC